MREELPDLVGSHLGGVALVVEKDKPPDPIRVSLLRAEAEVAEARDGAHLIKEFRLVHSREEDGVC
jgi:hypothetical protein